MIEKIYTIPVNEAFDLNLSLNSELNSKDPQNPQQCPICALYKKLEENELELILGASMMEPDTRIKTNEQGFCGRHFDLMFIRNNMLGLALMLQSHLSENINKSIKGNFADNLFNFGKKNNTKKLEKSQETCYICTRLDGVLTKMQETCALLFEREREFRDKLAKQPYFCLPHYASLLKIGEYMLDKKIFTDYSQALKLVQQNYSQELLADISHFIKKFDYNYQDEPWGNSKDSVERAIKFLNQYKNLR